ncbi:ABC transporter ATP-binding protein [endosymbiont of Riftia pachyptila]|uniref:Teichoic acids export ATP-binding protein tagH n=1 Tax=endosymbiont of Riftia pachyptila (vent Ph05) TaxID=1048808 RepID=G2DHX0_9GAMM|nr:ATP-binding cassette domain-containing protein [endosymbiont of Riftia pachyptila]EGV49784.1 teichoic acids export ATP-binding protein tagH [endosymbiont of Riftia pachyptila (vent Ph05)]
MKPLISLQDVGVRYKRSGNVFRQKSYFEALKSINLDIYPGETLGILGRNGAGKSTLLKIISGIIQPDHGRIINRGASVSLLALQAGFDANLSGRDNAILSGMLQGYSRRAVEARLGEIQEYSELENFFFEPVRTYSTGMRARLGFSVTTIICPDVMLIDEVLGVGDQHFRQKAERTMVAKLHSQQTVVLVSHSHQQIARLCERAVLIHDGVSYTTGEPHEVLKIYEEKLATS